MIHLTGILQFMKKKVLIPLLVVGALAGFFSFKYINADDSDAVASTERKSVIISTVMNAIQNAHYSPRPVDDSFSKAIYNKMLDNLDYDRKLFTQQDIDKIKDEQFHIDDELKMGSSEFFDRLNKLFYTVVDRADSFQKEILRSPFDYSKNETIEMDANKLPWPNGEVALKERWRLYLKYRCLSRYIDLKKDRDALAANKDSAKVVKKTDAQLEQEARESIAKNQERFFKRLRQFDDNERFGLYVNTIANCEDPHTDYFAPKTKKDFEIAMSGSFYGIGAQLKEEDGKTKIVMIIPGSPCWKQGELKAGDIILKVARGSGAPLDIMGYEIEDVVDKIRGEKGTEVRLTVKSVDGSIKVIPIIRGEVKLDDTFAKSAVFKSKSGPVGYIYLPEFYADFNHINGRRCADDVAKEVIKLKNAGVTGIILDLRGNGGGSLTDVVDMGGIFVNQGPMVQVKSANAPASTLSDREDGTLYDGPMAIMVNAGSASASEIMAAAMQDYKRAIIVGTTTFGKGTVQKVIELSDFMNPVTRMKMVGQPPIGAIKLTVQKFYRINGGSTQLRGVTPDIILPDAFSELDMGERKDKAAMPWDEIAPAQYTPVNDVNTAFLKAASEKRTTANPVFEIIAESAKKLKKQRDDNVYSLNEITFKKELDDAAALSKKLDELQKKATPIPVVNLKEDLSAIDADSTTIAKNKTWLKNLQKDIYISETINIVNDMQVQKGKVDAKMGRR
ncbi:MAG: carboxy terminal-processing peptidase [Bacteroidetes bacterium]|nr:carboxy terminal-processing peptidase [Bacteroidota bacterium]